MKALTSLFLVFASSQSFADVITPTTPVVLRSLIFYGSGCPDASVAAEIAEDKQSITFHFANFEVSRGPGISLMQSRKNCLISFDLDYTSNYRFAVVGVEYSGFARVPSAGTAEYSNRFAFQTLTPTGSSTANWSVAGPKNSDLSVRNEVVPSGEIFSPCGEHRTMFWNSAVRLQTDPNQSALITGDSLDLQTDYKIILRWRQC